jgi:hypothetical protein
MGEAVVHPHVLLFRQTGLEETVQQREQRKEKGSSGKKLLQATRGSHTIALETPSTFASTVIPDQYLVLYANETYTLQPVRLRCSHFETLRPSSLDCAIVPALGQLPSSRKPWRGLSY